MSLISKIQSLISSANAVTGESRTDLTSAVQDLKDGYGGSTVEKGLVFSEYDSDGYPHKAEFVGSWTEIPNGYCYYLFYNEYFTKEVTGVNVPEGVTKLGTGSFQYIACPIVLPSTLETIMGDAFNQSRISSITIPDSVIFIGGNSFRNSWFTSITIPAGIQTVEGYSFANNSYLTSVTYSGNVPNILATTFGSCPSVTLYDFSHATSVPSLYNVNALGHANGCVIKVPQSLLSTWQNETNWSALTNVTWQGV